MRRQPSTFSNKMNRRSSTHVRKRKGDGNNQSSCGGYDQGNNKTSVQVAVRVRPFVPKETGATSCLDIEPSQRTVQVGGKEGSCFTYDHVLPSSTNQKQLYSTCIAPLVKSCIAGFNSTVLAYGQTGSGKTHTIVGSSLEEEINNADEFCAPSSCDSSGIIPRALRDIFQRLEAKKATLCTSTNECRNNASASSSESSNSARQPFEYDIHIQFLELYGEEIRDLLSPTPSNKLSIRDGVNGEEPEVIGAIKTKVHSPREALEYLKSGTSKRVTAATDMNAQSSRSHAIISVTVEQRTLTKTEALQSGGGKNKTQVQNAGDNKVEAEEEVKRSMFHFVDLAGSERQKRTRAEGLRLKEGIDINLGLLVLGNVISALGNTSKSKRTFVPYRDSKLTRLLKGSLGGNHRTLMIACVSPASINMEESLNCLRYANRAKNIKNNAVVNLDPRSKLIADLRLKCRELTKEVLRVRTIYNEDTRNSNRDLEEGSPFSQQMLLDLAAGKDVKNWIGTKLKPRINEISRRLQRPTSGLDFIVSYTNSNSNRKKPDDNICCSGVNAAISAFWNCGWRALEFRRGSAAKVKDPYAESLMFDGGWLHFEKQGNKLNRFFTRNAVLNRTLCYDSNIMRGVKEFGIRQVVIFGSGLDTRAFRLFRGYPEVHVIEVDNPIILAYKESRLNHITPTCKRSLLPLNHDQITDWDFHAHDKFGFDPAKPTIFVLEGFSVNVPLEIELELYRKINANAAVNSIVTGCSQLVFGSPLNLGYGITWYNTDRKAMIKILKNWEITLTPDCMFNFGMTKMIMGVNRNPSKTTKLNMLQTLLPFLRLKQQKFIKTH